MSGSFSPETALTLALKDAGVPITEEAATAVVEALTRNNWRLVGPREKPTGWWVPGAELTPETVELVSDVLVAAAEIGHQRVIVEGIEFKWVDA